MMFWMMLWRITQIVFVFLGLYGLYNLIVSSGMFKSYRPVPGSDTPQHRFALLISARNEDRVISNLVSSLRQLDYPDELYEVFVIADNCTDRTAEVAREAGAIVYERFDQTRRSKGFALNWFFKRFFRDFPDRFDTCIIFDADNVVPKEYLNLINRKLNTGYRVLASYRISKNPEDSVIAGCNSLFWFLQHRVHDHPRAVYDLSLLTTGGTGLVFDLSLIRESGWYTTSITEDNEFVMDQILKGAKVGYAHTAYVYDESPVTFEQTYKQQCRWKLGTKELFEDKTPLLAKEVLKGKWRLLDPFLFSLGFPFMVIAPINWLLSLISRLMLTSDLQGMLLSLIPASVIGYLIFVGFIVVVTRAEKQRWKGQWKAFLAFPLYVTFTTLLSYHALFNRQGEWHPIRHTDSKSIDQVEKVMVSRQED